MMTTHTPHTLGFRVQVGHSARAHTHTYCHVHACMLLHPAGGEPLELAHKTQVVVFDKTGTLTQGKASVASISLLALARTSTTPDRNRHGNGTPKDAPNGVANGTNGTAPAATSSWGMPRVLRLLGAVESCSEHPLGKAIVEHAAAGLAGAGIVSGMSSCGSVDSRDNSEGGAAGEQGPLWGEAQDFEAVPGRGVRCRWVSNLGTFKPL